MKYITFLLMIQALLAQDPPKTAPEAAAAKADSTKSMMLIDPKARANDFAQAFEFLRKDKPTQKIQIRTSNTVLQSVSEVSASSGGTFLMIKLLTNQGVRVEFVPIEQVMEIQYSP